MDKHTTGILTGGMQMERFCHKMTHPGGNVSRWYENAEFLHFCNLPTWV